MTDHAALQRAIEAAWDGRDAIDTSTGGDVRAAVSAALDLLDSDDLV